jgi:hypothetical protein
LDQASLAGAKAPKPEPLTSLKYDAYGAYIKDYEDTFKYARSEDERAKGLVGLRERLPTDIMWLFDDSGPSDLLPFIADISYKFDLTIKKTSPQYEVLVKALIDQCMNTKTSNYYSNVNELKDVINLDGYRINSLH